MRPVILDGRKIASQSMASKRLGKDRSYVSRIMNSGNTHIRDVEGKWHTIRYADNLPVICPCCGRKIKLKKGIKNEKATA